MVFHFFRKCGIVLPLLMLAAPVWAQMINAPGLYGQAPPAMGEYPYRFTATHRHYLGGEFRWHSTALPKQLFPDHLFISAWKNWRWRNRQFIPRKPESRQRKDGRDSHRTVCWHGQLNGHKPAKRGGRFFRCGKDALFRDSLCKRTGFRRCKSA